MEDVPNGGAAAPREEGEKPGEMARPPPSHPFKLSGIHPRVLSGTHTSRVRGTIAAPTRQSGWAFGSSSSAAGRRTAPPHRKT